MLIETPYKVGDVITIKLTSGEELVGKFEADDDTKIKVNKPLTLVAGQKGIGLQQFAKWMLIPGVKPLRIKGCSFFSFFSLI